MLKMCVYNYSSPENRDGNSRSWSVIGRLEAFDRPTILTDRLFNCLTDRLTDRYDRSTDRYN